MLLCFILDTMGGVIGNRAFWAPVAYADDLAIITPVESVATVFKILKETTDELGLVINVKPDGTKSAVMPINAGPFAGAAVDAVKGAAAAANLPIVPHYTYLGTRVTPELEALPAIEMVRRDVIAQAKEASDVLGSLSLTSRAAAWRTFIQPLLLPLPLGASPPEETVFSQVYCETMRHFLMLPKTVPDAILCAITRATPRKAWEVL